jgi:LmbE family N-acetylglucosaminyl deacetylase
MLNLTNIKKVIFIAAHTDDEMIAAGTLRKFVKEGIIVKELAFSYAPIPDKTKKESRKIMKEEFLSATKIMGIPQNNLKVFDFEPRYLPNHENDIRQAIYEFTLTEKPDIAFILSPTDDHQDHAIVGRLSERVMKNRVPIIIRCHYPWNIINPGRNNLFVKLTPDEFKTKLAVIKIYKSQHFRYNYEKIYTALVQLNGLVIKNELAEAFEIVHLTI